MNQPNETVLQFHCGVCAKQLTDATALFTGCGHFFCSTPESKCTELSVTQGSGRCEQCGKRCDVGRLTNRGSAYDSRVHSFVFSSVIEQLRQTADIIEFRDRHLAILAENVATQQKRINTLLAERKSQTAEKELLKRENQQLREDLARRKPTKLPRNLKPPTATDTYGQQGSEGNSVIDLDPPVKTRKLQLSTRRDTFREGVRTNREAQASTRTRTLPEQMYDRSLRARSIQKRKESQLPGTRLRETASRGIRKDIGSGTLKRQWANRGGTNGVQGSSKAGRKGNSSRFGYPAGESRGTVRDPYKSRQRFGGDWQRKVSSVPRPSATPDKLRRVIRRSVPTVNLVGKRY